MRPIDLAGFNRKFAGDADPWRTFTDRDEARKRRAILHGLGGRPTGRLLELAAGNGSNSVALAHWALRLDATEGTPTGVDLVRRAIGDNPRVRIERLILPGRFPREMYDAVVIAEVLYYLSPHAMTRVAAGLARALRPGGRLVLAHHRIEYPDFTQRAEGIHDRFLLATNVGWRRSGEIRTGRWEVRTCERKALCGPCAR